MSIGSVVFLKRSKMPTPAQWAAAIRKAGFEFELDTDFDVETFGGYLPCTYLGTEAGFEYSFGESQGEELTAAQRRDIGDRDLEILFTTHSRLMDLAAAAIAGGVLASIADGVLWDQETNDFWKGAASLDRTRSLLEEVGAALEKEKAPRPPAPADLSTAVQVEVKLEAKVVFRGGTLLTLETLEKPTPRRFNVSLQTEDLPKVESAQILALWGCQGRPATVMRLAMQSTERTFDRFGSLQLDASQVDFKKWIDRLGEVEAATRTLLAAGEASVPHLLEAAADSKRPAMARQMAVMTLGALGTKAVSALPKLKALSADPDLANAVARALGQIDKPR